MLFTYWTGQTAEPPSVSAWREKYSKFRVFGDADVLPLINSDALRGIYNRIAIPSCKSDIARLLLLQAYGGLYVDAHAAPSSADRLVETLEVLASFDLIVFDKIWKRKEIGDIHIINSALAARRKTSVLDELIYSAFHNLSLHKQAECKTEDYVPYNIFVLTGAWDISVRLFNRSIKPYQLRPQFKESVFIHEMIEGIDPGFQLYKFYQYRKPGDHWSERQLVERLFKSKAVAAP